MRVLPSTSAPRVAEPGASGRGCSSASQTESDSGPSTRPAKRRGTPSVPITSTAHASAIAGTIRCTRCSTPSPGQAPATVRLTSASSFAAPTDSREAPGAMPSTPGAAKVTHSSAPPPGVSRKSTVVASWPTSGRPRPSPGLSERGCIPRPSSETTITSSSRPADASALIVPGARST